MTLYELTNQLLMLAEMAEDPDLDPQTLTDTMEAVEGDFAVKAEGYARVLRNLDAQEKVLRDESERLKHKADAIKANAGRIKERLKASMVAVGQTDIRTDLFHLYVKRNQPSLILDDPDKVGKEYLIPQPPTVDKKAIKEDLKAGLSLPWCHLEQGTSLVIK